MIAECDHFATGYRHFLHEKCSRLLRSPIDPAAGTARAAWPGVVVKSARRSSVSARSRLDWLGPRKPCCPAGAMADEVDLAIEMDADAIEICKTIHPHASLG